MKEREGGKRGREKKKGREEREERGRKKGREEDRQYVPKVCIHDCVQEFGIKVVRKEKTIGLFSLVTNFSINLQMSGSSHSSLQFTRRAAGTREVTGCWQPRARGK